MKIFVAGRTGANASDSKPARLLAVIVVDAADEQLTIPDPPEPSVKTSQTKGGRDEQR